MRFFSFFLFLATTLFAINIEMVDSPVTNGRTALLKFEKEKNTEYTRVLFNEKSYKIFENPLDDGKFYALLPVSYYEKAADKKVEIFYVKDGTERRKTLFFKVESAEYEKETLSVDGSKVTLSQEDKKRASKEYAEAMKIYKSVSSKNYIVSEFMLPLKSKITSNFGTARVYNGRLKSYHGGTDFRADTGTPLAACNNGKVVLAKERFYSGGSIVIDHGQGVYSCYFHMSKLTVKKGTKVQKGDIIGLSGSSGRVTGPHLHFAIRVAGEQVDPLHFIELVNKQLIRKNSKI